MKKAIKAVGILATVMVVVVVVIFVQWTKI